MRSDFFILTRSFDLNERGARVDLHVRHDHHIAHSAGKRGDNLRLHFHGLEYSQPVPSLDGIASFHRNGNHYRGRGRMHYAAIVAIHAMCDTLYFNPETDSLDD